MIRNVSRTRRRRAALAYVLASLAVVVWSTACASRKPGPAQTDAKSSVAERVEPSSASPAADVPFAWPVPAGWRTETIPFPLGFAPTLPYTGIEELRFAPGMFKAGSDDFWTYA